ncbi:MAG: Mor transcription activator family protein [Syntrophorhabdales bacterium]|jgi:Mor family transcriptional regulator
MTEQKHSKVGEEVTFEDLHPVYRKIAKVIGVSDALILGREFGGQSIYFPKVHAAILLKARHQMIAGEFNGHNYSDPARKYDLTEAWIRQLIKRNRKAK